MFAPMSEAYDIEFYWDPICPFAWITSRWITKVAEQRDFRVDWRFISLRFLNEHRDYAEFPANYLSLHTMGQRMLRVAAAARAAHGRPAMAALYTAYGESIWHRRRVPGVDVFDGIADAPHLRSSLQTAGLDSSFADAADDDRFDDELRAEVATALSRTGPGVGTPVRGGLDYRESHMIMELVADSGQLLALDLVEVNPTLDTRNATAEFAAELALSALGMKIL